MGADTTVELDADAAAPAVGADVIEEGAADTLDKVLVSHTGHRLTRRTAFRFAADPNRSENDTFFMCAGARRFTVNHHIGRVKHNLDVRRAEHEAGVPKEEMTPSLSWSKVSFVNHFNAWKNGQADDSPVDEDGFRGLDWRHEIPADVFECASVDAAQALANFSNSVNEHHLTLW